MIKASGISFFTIRVLQRWCRGEITTDAALDLIQPDEAARIMGAWNNDAS